MALLTKKTISLILCAWAIILIVAVLGKQWYVNRYFAAAPAARQEARLKPFVFDKPTEQELYAMQKERRGSTAIALPLTKDVAIFKCPAITCARLGYRTAGEEILIDIAVIKDTDAWIPVPWTDTKTGRVQQGFVAIADLENAYQNPPALPKKSLDINELELSPAQPVAINPQTLVGIVCEFKKEGDEDERRITRGSGAIITDDGSIITARSVVDIAYLNEGLEDYHLLNCLVGQMPATQSLPNIDEIKKINAFVRLPFLAYTAELAYIPPDAEMSDYEKAWLDFAVLKINGVNPDARYFGGPTEVPDLFPVAPILISDLPKKNERTLNFAFPSGTTIGNNADIKTLFMQGLLSHVVNYWAGDKQYADDLFLVETYMDTEDTAGGRFGSPLFWKGYMIGIHTAKQPESREIYTVSAKAILGNLFDNQFAIPLEVH